MVYHIHTETPDGVSVESITRQHVAEAYDHCRDCLNGNPDATAVISIWATTASTRSAAAPLRNASLTTA